MGSGHSCSSDKITQNKKSQLYSSGICVRIWKKTEILWCGKSCGVPGISSSTWKYLVPFKLVWSRPCRGCRGKFASGVYFGNAKGWWWCQMSEYWRNVYTQEEEIKGSEKFIWTSPAFELCGVAVTVKTETIEGFGSWKMSGRCPIHLAPYSFPWK